MTLSVVFDKEKYDSIMNVIPEITMVWKVVMMNPLTRCYEAPHVSCTYKDGQNKAEYYKPDYAEYPLFYHFWVNKIFVLERLNVYLEQRAKQIEKLENLRRDFRQAEEFYHNLFGGRSISPDEYYGRRYGINPNRYFQVMPELHNWHIIPRVICCAIRKDWIDTIGKQDEGLAVVCQYAIFPKYPSLKPDPNTIVMPDITNDVESSPSKVIKATKIGQPKMMEELISV